jgi:hypothetical protein
MVCAPHETPSHGRNRRDRNRPAFFLDDHVEGHAAERAAAGHTPRADPRSGIHHQPSSPVEGAVGWAAILGIGLAGVLLFGVPSVGPVVGAALDDARVGDGDVRDVRNDRGAREAFASDPRPESPPTVASAPTPLAADRSRGPRSLPANNRWKTVPLRPGSRSG